MHARGVLAVRLSQRPPNGAIFRTYPAPLPPPLPWRTVARPPRRWPGWWSASPTTMPRTASACCGSRRAGSATSSPWWARRLDFGRRVSAAAGLLGQRPHPWSAVQGPLPQGHPAHHGRGHREVPGLGMIRGIEPTAMIRVLVGISFALTDIIDERHCGHRSRPPSPLEFDAGEVVANMPEGELCVLLGWARPDRGSIAVAGRTGSMSTCRHVDT